MVSLCPQVYPYDVIIHLLQSELVFLIAVDNVSMVNYYQYYIAYIYIYSEFLIIIDNIIFYPFIIPEFIIVCYGYR